MTARLWFRGQNSVPLFGIQHVPTVTTKTKILCSFTSLWKPWDNEVIYFLQKQNQAAVMGKFRSSDEMEEIAPTLIEINCWPYCEYKEIRIDRKMKNLSHWNKKRDRFSDHFSYFTATNSYFPCTRSHFLAIDSDFFLKKKLHSRQLL